MRLIFILFFIPLAVTASAQKMKFLSGSLKGLKEQGSYNLVFRYDSMTIGTEMSEKAYLAEKKRQWDLKEPGRGSDFVAQWFDARQQLYEPAFIKTFERYSKVKIVDEGAKYTLVVKTTRTEGGWTLGVMAHPGEIDGELWVVEAAGARRAVAKIGFYFFRGKARNGGDFEMTDRIGEAYSLAGEGLGDFLRRKSK